MTTNTDVPRGSERQTFLVGPTLYLRGIEIEDAKTGPSWYPSPFPLPVEVLEERLRKEASKEDRRRGIRLIACRTSDDRPVGSAFYHTEDWLFAFSNVFVEPTLSATAGGEITAELIRLLVPYLIEERDLMAVWFETAAGDPLVESAVAETGMRFAYRLREALLVDGQRRDQMCYEALHPAWVERLGLPPEGTEGPIEREVRSPAPREFPKGSIDPPANALMIGERLYLRAFEASDAINEARWSRQETETFFDNGRPIHSPIRLSDFHRKLAEEDPPEWIRFAICLRENNEMIGSNGLSDIDWVNRTAETETTLSRPEYRGGGLGTEAKHLMLAYAFERIGLHMVRSYVWEPNGRSAAALRKQGYRGAGRCAWTGLKNGNFVGDFVFDLLASEWQAARK